MQRVTALHSWINNLPPPVREAVVQRMRPRRYAAGEAVYMLGEQGNELYMVVSGKVRFCNYTERGKEIQMAEIRAGDCFGELSLIDGLHRPSCAYATGPTELLVLQKKDFEELRNEHIEICLQMSRLLSHRLRVAYTIIEDATALPMKDRLARMLARLGYSIGAADANGATVIEGFTHETLARMLGSTREGISRELKQLEEVALIRRSYGKIVVPDLNALIDQCDGLVGGEEIVPGYF